MRKLFRWRLPRQSSLEVLCACFALCSLPAAATATVSPNTVQIGGVSLDRRVLAFVAMVGLVGTIAGLAARGPRAPRVRLLTRPRKTRVTVLVPPGPTPRLVPGESPNATRARPAPAPVLRTAPAGTGSGIIDYIAPFAGPEEASVDYLLEPDDSAESPDPSTGDG